MEDESETDIADEITEELDDRKNFAAPPACSPGHRGC